MLPGEWLSDSERHGRPTIVTVLILIIVAMKICVPGHYVPQLSQTIVRYNFTTKAKSISICDEDSQSFILSSELCDKIMDIAREEIGNIDLYNIFTPPCNGRWHQSEV
uniref:Uncharacterized protein n=1 Tax=Vitis vinifera TaxID=29760 RepID=F6HYM1_VITVI